MPKQIDTVTTQLEPFVLKLPKEFDLKPNHVVDLPARHKALIFKDTVVIDAYDDNGKKRTKRDCNGWRVIVVTKSGLPSRSFDRDFKTTNRLSLQIYIQRTSIELTKRKRTQVTENDNDD